jgi:hypothetical protein
MALALEHLGYTKYKSENIIDRADLDTKEFNRKHT